MPSESPNPSWHPALMPDHESPPKTPPARPIDSPSSHGSPDSLHNGTPLEPEAEAEPHAFDFSTADDQGDPSAWLAKDEIEEGGASLSRERPPPQATDTTDPTIGEDSPPKKASQHSSSRSFARTVSHEISFGDDDEGEWSFPRTNTDPFKFMAPSDRTNSFPVVPPITPKTGDHVDHPLPAYQALDVLEEAEKDEEEDLRTESQVDLRDDAAPNTGAASTGPRRGRHGPSPSMGGDVQAFEEQATDIRNQEHDPLIHNTEERQEGADSTNHASPNLFGEEEEAGGDDFFTQIQDSPQNGSADAPKPPLERKTTAQVMGALLAEPPTRQNTMDTVSTENGVRLDDDSTREPAPAKSRGHKRTKTEDLNAKWQAAFGSDDDEDFLLEDSSADDKDLDPSAFLGSDDEGLLDENEDPPLTPRPIVNSSQSYQPASRQGSVGNPYAPQNAYQPAAPVQQQAQPFAQPPAATAAFGAAPQYGRPPIQGVDQPKAQSFADKSKGGYHSPYDLPTDIVGSVPKPRKRPSPQHLPTPGATPQPGPHGITRSASTGMTGIPTANTVPPASQATQGPPDSIAPKASMPSLRSKGSFFEELPIVPKARPTSRHSQSSPSPAHQTQSLGPSPLGPPMNSQAPLPPTNQSEISPPSSGYGNLVAPDRVSPYASLQSGAIPAQQPASNSTRYSPAPANAATGNAAPPPPTGNRYSPAPSAPRQSSYSPSRNSTSTPPYLPHQPRTSSPLAHYETNSGKAFAEMALAERRSSSSSHEPRLNRVPSLPPTREVDEEEDQSGQGAPLGSRQPSMESRYSPMPPAQRTSPPHSPTKRTVPNYAPQPQTPSHPSSQPGFVPPPRAQTGSPNAAQGKPSRPHGHVRRPSSAHSPATFEMTGSTEPSYTPQTRKRGQSMAMNMVAPTDGREQDPLERWRGVPIFAWGVGGTVVTSFPKSVPRYTIASSTPTVSRTPGEVKVMAIKEISPLPDRLSHFPGPLKGKSRKKEAVNWLTAGIETLEKEIPDVSFHSELSLGAKREMERLLLWKILRIFIEHDGSLEGTPTVEKAVRDVLSPDLAEQTHDAPFGHHTRMVSSGAPATAMQSDAVDAGTMEKVRNSLAKGEREAAVWIAVDQRLWGHAMLIANTVSPDLYRQVSQEFVRKEVNYPGHKNEPMAALYKILSGSYDDCVDELVPSHARAGFQMVSTDSSTGPTKDAVDGLDKWRETLALVLSNRSSGDIQGLRALGNLLASYGRAEAAHICFMFSRNAAVFGGLDDPNADFVLLGSDHKQQVFQFAKETEPLQLSEVYEFGLSLAGSVAASSGAPHLAAYKFQHAVTLAEHGYRDKALQYCDAIAAAMSSQTKRSAYYNGYLAASVENFMVRLKQAPKGESGSWISKPSMNKVSDSMWSKFNKFVAGDDEDGNGPGGPGNADNSPFTHIGTTPTISRSPSTNNFDMYGGGAPTFPAAGPPLSAAAAALSKYAPAVASQQPVPSNPYNPAPQYSPMATAPEKAGEYPSYAGSSAEPSYLGTSPAQGGAYAPTTGYQPSQPSQPDAVTYSSGYEPQSLPQSSSMPALSSVQGQADTATQSYFPPTFGYDPPQMNSAIPDVQVNEAAEQNQGSGFEPPSLQAYGYEPPSYEPDAGTSAQAEDDEPKPRMKSFMDDDEDDIPALRPADNAEKSKAEKDREADEMFRKAAEEDGKPTTPKKVHLRKNANRNEAKRAAEEKGGKKGWGFGGWFGKRAESPKPAEQGPKAVRANLGEASSFVYDPDLKRWVNKKPGAENVEAKKPAPPPPRAGPRSAAGTPPPPTGTPPPNRSASAAGGPPPPRSIPPGRPVPELTKAPSQESMQGTPPPLAAPMSRSISNTSITGGGPPSAPPSRPGTSMSNASSIDDLLSASGPRKAGKKPRKSGRYVDVMAK